LGRSGSASLVVAVVAVLVIDAQNQAISHAIVLNQTNALVQINTLAKMNK